MRGAYQPSIGLRGAENVAKNFCDVSKSFSHVANRRPCNIQRRMSRACCERVPSMLRTRLRATSNIGRLSSPSLTCCDHVATMLRPVLRATSKHQKPSPLPPRHKPNITCLQHRNSTSATLKINICNTQQYVSATSILDIRNI
jgi:hypothetical protein